MLIKTWRDPYDAGFTPTRPKEIDILPGLTVLVGCNGAGKSTLLLNIEEVMWDKKIPVHLFDNLVHGRSNGVGDILTGFGNQGDIGDAINLLYSSEGEAIKINLGRQSRLYKEFFRTGHFKDSSYRFSRIFSKGSNETPNDNRRVLLFDAVDSGMSVDAICEVKDLFDLILKDANELGIELYLIISANEYELARGENCFDVNAGKYIQFTDYEDYRQFILKSRKKKERRIKQQEEWYKEKESNQTDN